jgi:hypothetical protein
MKPKTYLFPGMENNWRADVPVATKVAWIGALLPSLVGVLPAFARVPQTLSSVTDHTMPSSGQVTVPAKVA